jgi:hypothetical protein
VTAVHAKATTDTIGNQLIAVPARTARSARRLRLHLPRDWTWEQTWTHAPERLVAGSEVPATSLPADQLSWSMMRSAAACMPAALGW